MTAATGCRASCSSTSSRAAGSPLCGLFARNRVPNDEHRGLTPRRSMPAPLESVEKTRMELHELSEYGPSTQFNNEQTCGLSGGTGATL